MNERRTTEWWKMAIQIVIIIVGLSGAYYKLDSRVTILEDKITQEVKGYEILLHSLNKRLDKFEQKLDCIGDKRFCNR